MFSTITSKGQVTLPKRIRDQLKLKPGDRLRFDALPDGTLLARPASRSALDAIGVLGRTGARAVSVAGMNDGIARAIAAKHRAKR